MGREDTLVTLHNNISRWVNCRNKALEENNRIAHKIAKVKLQKARRGMKRKLRPIERAWWEDVLEECKTASETGSFGTVYSFLKKLGTRNLKPCKSTTLLCQDFKKRFSKVGKNTHENPPAGLQATLEKIPYMRDQERLKNNEPLEEQNIENKEEKFVFGYPKSDQIRMLGCWLGPTINLQNRINIAHSFWATVRLRLVRSKLLKRQQAIILQACVESGLLLDAHTRPWKTAEIKKMQNMIDRIYRCL